MWSASGGPRRQRGLNGRETQESREERKQALPVERKEREQREASGNSVLLLGKGLPSPVGLDRACFWPGDRRGPARTLSTRLGNWDLII